MAARRSRAKQFGHESAMRMHKQALSFALLDRKIREIPDGPASVLNASRWEFRLNVVGLIAAGVGLLPGALIHLMPPAHWMVVMARTGLYVMVIAFLPWFVRSLVVVVKEFGDWRAGFMAQSDHDRDQFDGVARWLSQFGVDELQSHLRFAQASSARLSAKLELLAGGLGRLGLLPVMCVVFLALANIGDITLERLQSTPWWVSTLGIFIVITYGIGVQAVRMRLLLQLHEWLLEDAIRRRESRN